MGDLGRLRDMRQIVDAEPRVGRGAPPDVYSDSSMTTWTTLRCASVTRRFAEGCPIGVRFRIRREKVEARDQFTP